MSSDLDKWEERWSRPGQWAGEAPAAFLIEILPLLPHGDVLDLAVGGGRNAVFLAENGWHVTGIDQAAAALEKTAAWAEQRGLRTYRGRIPSAGSLRPREIHLVQADLASSLLPKSSFDAVVCLNFLLRSLAGEIIHSLRPGGRLVYETYTLDQLNFEGGPRNSEFLLRPGELKELFAGLDVVFYREVSAGKGIASLLARKQ